MEQSKLFNGDIPDIYFNLESNLSQSGKIIESSNFK
jgi:hypothetical protein